jgi:hypothetical protein
MTSPASINPSTALTTAPAPSSIPAQSSTAEILPNATTLLQAARLSIQLDKPIQLDYYVDTATNRAFIGEDSGEAKEKILVKTKEEFTSLITKLYRVGEEYLVVTENSIYIVSGKIQKRRVNLASLHGEE